jgi:hypothetical protein
VVPPVAWLSIYLIISASSANCQPARQQKSQVFETSTLGLTFIHQTWYTGGYGPVFNAQVHPGSFFTAKTAPAQDCPGN